MAKIHELLGLRKAKTGDLGIEIEYEGKKFHAVDTALWKTEDDGSLRGAYPESRGEYVLKSVIPADTVAFALNELKVEVKEAVPSFSFRTSVHVHVNVQNMTEEQVQNFLYAAHLLEEPLANFCGNSRKGNRFCLRVQDADGIVEYLKTVFHRGVKEALRLNENSVRYAFINVASLRKYGSVEFRGMRGTLDVEVLNIWATALVSIRNYSCHHKNCLDIHDEFVTRGPIGFLEHVLGELSKHFLYKTCEKDMQTSYSLLYELPYEFKAGVEERAALTAVATKPKEKKDVVVEVFNQDNWPDFENIVMEQLRPGVQIAQVVNGAPQAAHPRMRRYNPAPVIYDDVDPEPRDVEEVRNE